MATGACRRKLWILAKVARASLRDAAMVSVGDRQMEVRRVPDGVGDTLPDMPLFLEPDGCVMVPLEATYQAAFAAQPRRWRDVLQPPG